MKRHGRHDSILVPLLAAGLFLSVLLGACGPTGPNRSFYMGTTPFFATPGAFPDWRMENLNDKDLLSIHADDFLGVPWTEFRDNLPLPAAWVTKWQTLAAQAQATGKVLYLAVSPLGNRRTLAPAVDSSGNPLSDWAPVDANGCYPFATDSGAAGYQTAYIRYVTWLINLVKPSYVSPGIEINVPFGPCASQKTAWIAWYTGVHNALKAAFPSLPIFATFQLETLYGISDAASACPAPTTLDQCFDQHLAEALSIPGDRIAFSTYPMSWSYRPEFGYSWPTDTFSRVASATSRPIWIAETGWPAVPILSSYPHGGSGSCGSALVPTSIANDSQQAAYMKWILQQAQKHHFETVIWWLNRDYLDGSVAATCPCSPASSDTCVLADNFYAAGGAAAETSLRLFGNMALRDYDGSARPSHATWRQYFDEPRVPAGG